MHIIHNFNYFVFYTGNDYDRGQPRSYGNRGGGGGGGSKDHTVIEIPTLEEPLL